MLFPHFKIEIDVLGESIKLKRRIITGLSLGGVAIGALIFSFLYWGFGFLKMGTGGLTAQALGAGDQDEVKSCLARSLIIGIPLGVIIILLQVPLSFLSFYLVEASQEVENLGGLYFETRIWGAPATLANFALVGWFVGMQNTKKYRL